MRIELLEPRWFLQGISLTFQVENPNYNTSNTYVTFIDGSLSATYDGGKAVVLNHSYSIDDLKGPIDLVSYSSGRIFVSLGAGVAGSYPPEPVNPDIPSYHVRHELFELTYSASDTSSVANLTAVDFFGIPLEMNTYHTGTPTPAQTLTYRIEADTLIRDLAALTGFNSETYLTENGQFLRVLSPHIRPLSQTSHYASMQPYIDAVKTWQSQGQPAHAHTIIEDLYSHKGSTPATKTQNYHFVATVLANGDMQLIGGGELVGGGGWAGSDHTILIAAADLPMGIYSGNPDYTVDGAAAHIADNDVYAAAVRDVLSGFNLGFMASETIDPNTSTAFGAEASKHWWSSTRAFDFLQPQHTYYNLYAKTITDHSDAYSWAFSDRWSHVQAALYGIDAMEIVILADARPQTAGLYDPAASAFYLRDSNSSGVADQAFHYGPGGHGWQPVVGDWDGDGVDTIGLYDPGSSVFYLRNANSSGVADLAFGYGPAGQGWLPIVGDWNGDGIDTIGLYNPSSSVFYLRNANGSGIADLAFGYGPAGQGWQPIRGDWNGDGIDTIGLYDPTGSVFYLRNANSSGVADTTFGYGPAWGAWRPITGDWDGGGNDTIGLYDPSGSVFYLRNTNSSGHADTTFAYGPPGQGWLPVVGDWVAPAGSSLWAAAGMGPGQGLPALSEAEIQAVAAQAIADWADLGLAADQLDALVDVRFIIADLPGAQLGLTERDTIFLDLNAAGHGWFIDPTPGADEEFTSGAAGNLTAIDPAAVDRIDLLTVVSHELGHTLGLADIDATLGGLMSGTLETGVRRGPGDGDVDAVFAAL